LGFLPIPLDDTAVCSLHASDDLRHRRFAGAVLAHQGHHFTRVDFQADPLQGVDSAVVFADIPGVQQGLSHRSLR
jgi:hypothetical protein